MAEIPSLGIFTYCYVLAWFNCQWVFASVLGPPPMPSRGHTNNSSLGGKWMVTPFPMMSEKQWNEAFDWAPAGVGDAQRQHARLWVGTRCAWCQLSPSEDKFLWGLVMNVPTPNLVIKIMIHVIITLNIDGEPSLLQFSCPRIVLTPLPVLTAMCSPSSSRDLTSGRKLSLIFCIGNKNCPSLGHWLSYFLFYFFPSGYFGLKVSWVVFCLFLVIFREWSGKVMIAGSMCKNREGDIEGIHPVRAEWMNTRCLA